jgi:CheY-like chemotaxis protein
LQVAELRTRAAALTRAIRAGRGGEGIDPRAPEDAQRVVEATDRFTDLWNEYLRLDRDPDEGVEAQRKRRHDLRTPIGHIIGYLELLGEGLEDVPEPGADVRAWMAEIERLLGTAETLAASVDLELKNSMPQPAARPSASRRPGAGARLLIIDDLEDNRGLLRRQLERDGHEVLEASGGEEGMACLRSEAPELLLLDIMMPGMDGHATLAKIRSEPQWRDLPIIMLSSLDDADEVARCIDAGAQDHIPRPFVPEVLRARVAALLERKHLLDEQRRQHAELLEAKQRIDDFVHYVVPMGTRLAYQRDLDQLVVDLLDAGMRFAKAGGGSLLMRDMLEAQGWRVVVSRGVGEARAQLAAHAAASLEPSLTLDGVWCLPLQDTTGITTAVLQLRELSATHSLDPLISLGSLAAAALERSEYERELRNKIELLEVQVDTAARQREVDAITETEYFQELRRRAKDIRAQRRSLGEAMSTSEGDEG